MKEFKKPKKKSKERVDPPDIKPILNSLTGGLALDPIMVEDLIMLAHGNVDESHLISLANRFNTPLELVKIFFLSLFLSHFKDEEEQSKFIEPMRRRIGVQSEILSAIINIVSY